MKKTFRFCLLCVLVLNLSLFSIVEKKAEITQLKNTRYTLCSQMTKDSLKDVKASKKKIEKGVVIVMTSSNPVMVKKLKDIIASCKGENTALDAEKKREREILSMAGVKIIETNLNNGIRLELFSEIPEVMDKIKRVKIPGCFRAKPKQDKEKK